jgi:zinc/manganese transport system permease protein
MFDHETLALMLQALSICLVLTGIHGYLGIHVLERKVIFVDLAMAQIAALGATYALFLGYDAHEDPGVVYLFSLGFTLTGAAVFSLTRMRHERVPQEAFIGIIYATASAIAILILAKSTTAGEHIKGMLIGDILRARWPQIRTTALIYAAIGVFHWAYRDRFFRITMKPDEAYASGIRVRLWDFLFYATFGVVITSSVAIGGVLLVFSFLVVPACIGVFFAETPARRILIAWGSGTLVSVLGIGFTFAEGNLPAGPVVVAAFALVLLLSALVRYVRAAECKHAALGRIGLGVLAVSVLAGGSWLLRARTPEEDPHEHTSEFDHLVEELRSGDETKQLHAIDHFLEDPDPHAVPELIAVFDRSPSHRVLEHLAGTLRKLGDPKAVPPLRKSAERADLDATLRFELAQAVVELKEPSGLGVLLQVAADESAPRLARVKAIRLFDRLTGRGSDLEKLGPLLAWWAEHGSHIRWRESTGRFE